MVDTPEDGAAQAPLPRANEPGAAEPPPLVAPETEFPFSRLEWGKFERLCQDIARTRGFTNVLRYGKPPQNQHGIDFTGVGPDGKRIAFQVRRWAELTAGDLKKAVRDYAEGSVAARTAGFIVCMSLEGNDSSLQEKLMDLNDEYEFPIGLWDSTELTYSLHHSESLVRKFFGPYWAEIYFGTSPSPGARLDPATLLLGPMAALDLAPRAQEAERLAEASPAEAAEVYKEIADELRDHVPGHSDRYERRRASALKDSGDWAQSHDVLMGQTIRELFDRAAPRLSPGVAADLRDLHEEVDEVRQARGAAVSSFERWHEDPEALNELAQSFDSLEPEEPYAPFVAVLLSEAAVADRAFQVVLDRQASLRSAGERGERAIGLRVQLALADAGVSEIRSTLLSLAESFRLPAREGAYVCLRSARWYSWNGELERAEQLYRLAVKLAAQGGLALDVENALWSLMPLYPAERYDELAETNELALSVQGSESYVRVNPRTREQTYRSLANREMPNAHLWSRHRLLESVRSGCLLDELESHGTLARVYEESDEELAALEHATLGGAADQIRDLAKVGTWPEFLAELVRSPAPWVRSAALSALERVGDGAPRLLARQLAHEFIDELEQASEDMRVAPALFQALQAVVLEATDTDLEQLMAALERGAPREPGSYRLTDPGVGMVAARVYRFRPTLRTRAAAILGQMAVGAHTGDWGRALRECGEDIDELVETLEGVAEDREIDLAGPLSDLGHLNTATRALFSKRLRFVDDHPLGARQSLALYVRYDIPLGFLREQGDSVAQEYVGKLLAIGANPNEAIVNRSAALESAAAVVELLPDDKKSAIFASVWPLTATGTEVSERDQDLATTMHPLNRIRLAFGSVTDLRVAALRLAAGTAVETSEREAVLETAWGWVRSGDGALQQGGAAVLTIRDISGSGAGSAELARHENPWVRQTAPQLAGRHANPDVETLEMLAGDPHPQVRIRVIYALGQIRDTAPDAYERIRRPLVADESALARAVAAQVLPPAG
ncbi:MAG: hypothetical protein F4Y92_03820 [Dehalococcoidia bacterium]|nr:hypothetical protein [Dehalococcoidia bacterium]